VEEEAESSAEADCSARLVAAIYAGERNAEKEMVERYSRGLLYLLRRRCGDGELALDLRQDTFRIAIEKLRVSPLDDPAKLAAFLRGVAMNLLVGHHRKQHRRATTTDTEAIERAAHEAPGPDADVQRTQIQRAVRDLLGELGTARDREVLQRVYLLEQDRERICADLGIDSVHFSRVLFRAKQRFRELLEAPENKRGLRLVG
jgi:RNA polymerase sigma-70 factor (ECF subfamily)